MPEEAGFWSTKSENIDDTINTLITGADVATNTTPVMTQLVRTYDMPDGSNMITVPFVSQISAQAWAEGQLLRESRHSGVFTRDLTVDKWGVMSVLTEELMSDSTVQSMAITGTTHGNAMGRLQDEELLKPISSFVTSFDRTTDGFNIKDVTALSTLIRTNRDARFGQRPPGERIAAVAHPLALDTLVANSLGANAASGALFDKTPVPSGITEHAIREWFVGRTRLGGVDIFMAENQSFTTGASANTTVGVFSPSAIAFTRKRQMETKMDEIIQMGATIMVTSARWGAKLFLDPRGGRISTSIADASYTAPTYA